MNDRPEMHALSAEQVGELWDEINQQWEHCYGVSVDRNANDVDYRRFNGGRASGLADARRALSTAMVRAQVAVVEERSAWLSSLRPTTEYCPICGTYWQTRIDPATPGADCIEYTCPAAHCWQVRPDTTHPGQEVEEVCGEQSDIFMLDGSEHYRGDDLCGACFGMPTNCARFVDGVPCLGVVHAKFLGVNKAGCSLLRRCDICGEAP